MPGGAELVREQRQRQQIPMAPPGTGRGIIGLSWAATAAFTLTSGAATVWFGSTLQAVAFVTAMALFASGCMVYVLAYAAGIRRSRTHELGIGGWFFLAGSAPGWAQRHLLGSFAVQVVVSLVVAGARPFTSLAFGVLAPLFGLACCGWWGGAHGAFGRRISTDGRAVRGARPGGSGGEGDR